MAGRRGNGEGSIYKRRSDGRWAGEYICQDDDGRPRRRQVYGRTRAEAVTKLQSAQRQVASGSTPPPERMTVALYLQRWLDDVAPSTVKPTTLDGYRWMVNRYWIDSIGHIRLSRLRPEHVQRVMRSMEQRSLSPRTIRQARAILRRALGQAERWGLVTQNAAALTDAPRVGRTAVGDALTASEARLYLNAAKDQALGAACIVAILTGLRMGEVLALRWSDVELDGDSPHLLVRGTLKRQKGVGLVVDRPKTDTSAREVALVSEVVEALRSHRVRQNALRLQHGPDWPDGDYIFTTPRGTPVDPSNFRKAHAAVCKSAGIGRRRFHALRHTWATLALAAGVTLEVVSTSLGHASLAITADVYAHVGKKAKQGAVEAVAAFIESA